MYNQAKQTKQTHNLLQMSTHTPPPQISPLPVKFIHRPTCMLRIGATTSLVTISVAVSFFYTEKNREN